MFSAIETTPAATVERLIGALITTNTHSIFVVADAIKAGTIWHAPSVVVIVVRCRACVGGSAGKSAAPDELLCDTSRKQYRLMEERIMRDLIEQELAFSRQIVADGHEVVPRFLIVTPDKELTVFCPLPDDIDVRLARLQLVSRFMALKLARLFVMSTELVEPDCVSAVAVTRDGCEAAVQMIRRQPLAFSELQWLPAEAIGDEVPGLFPKVREELTAQEMHDIEWAVATFSA